MVSVRAFSASSSRVSFSGWRVSMDEKSGETVDEALILARKRFGKWVQKTRDPDGKGPSQRELAKLCDISSASVSKIEDGLVGTSPKMMSKLAKGLGLPRKDIVAAWSNAQNNITEDENNTIAPGMKVNVIWKEGEAPRPIQLTGEELKLVIAYKQVDEIGGTNVPPMPNDNVPTVESKDELLSSND